MKAVAVAALLAVVLAATALDLALGILWVACVLGLFLLRRRLRLVPVLVLLGSAALLGWGVPHGWFPAPAPASYEGGWLPAWPSGETRSVSSMDGSGAEPRILAAREQLGAFRREELRLTGSELEQRAAAVVDLARRLGPWRTEAPREVAAVEAATRRLARTLAAPEFRDLERRRGAAATYLAELDRRLAATRDAAEAASALRAADPAAMAHVSLRPVREDLAAADGAIGALVTVLGGGVPSVTTTAAARYDESRKETQWELRYGVAGTRGIRLLRVELRPFKGVVSAGGSVSLAFAPGGEAARPVPAGSWLELEPAPRGVVIISTWTGPAASRPVGTMLRRLPFERLEVAAPTTGDDALALVVLDGRPGIEVPLSVLLPAPRLRRVSVARHALFFTSRPGTVTADAEGDNWEAVGEGASTLNIEMVPKSFLLRNAAFTAIRPYLYRPNPATVVAAIGLAALTLLLGRRPRPASTESR